MVARSSDRMGCRGLEYRVIAPRRSNIAHFHRPWRATVRFGTISRLALRNSRRMPHPAVSRVERPESPPSATANSSFSRQLCAANAVPVEHLVVVHRDGHLGELACELEGTFVVRDRRAAVASDVEARPRDKVRKAETRLDAACRHAIDQQREFATARPRVHSRLYLPRETTHADAEPALPRRYRRGRSHDHMLASDIHVVDKMTGLQIQAVAGGRVAMGYEDAFACFGDVNVAIK